jgi:hypothetical protein
MITRDKILTAEALVVTLVVVWQVGPFGLLLIPVVLAEIAAMIWGKSSTNREEPNMGTPTRRSR